MGWTELCWSAWWDPNVNKEGHVRRVYSFPFSLPRSRAEGRRIMLYDFVDPELENPLGPWDGNWTGVGLFPQGQSSQRLESRVAMFIPLPSLFCFCWVGLKASGSATCFIIGIKRGTRSGSSTAVLAELWYCWLCPSCQCAHFILGRLSLGCIKQSSWLEIQIPSGLHVCAVHTHKQHTQCTLW